MSTETIPEKNWKNPPGILLIRTIRGKDWTITSYRYVVLLVTFIAYAAYHASRKPSSIVKSVLDPGEKGNIIEFRPWPIGEIFIGREGIEEDELGKNKGWAPFNGKDGTSRLGAIDVAFLGSYAMGMYVAGHLGDKLDLRLFLTTGMIGSGIFVGLFGMGYFWDIHVFAFYLAMQMVAGLFQATGWPSVVAVIGNWFGKRKRGLIMGVWNAHTSVGNITGSLLAAGVLQYGWGWSFILPGAFIVVSGIIVYLFLAAYPEDVGFDGHVKGEGLPQDEEAQIWRGNSIENENNGISRGNSIGNENNGISRGNSIGNENNGISRGSSIGNESNGRTSGNRRSIGLLEACFIPGVIPYALCLFFAKLVAYTFLYWLPYYLSQTAIEGQYMSVKSAGNLSTLFDVGGIIGGVLAGHISDKLEARAITAASFMYTAIPAMLVFRKYGSISKVSNAVLMMLAGLLVNGPYALITTAVSADLGTHTTLKGDSRALATVTAIIDGTGSLGAALGPLLTGFLSSKGWDAVFYMLILGAFAAGLLLTHLVIDEIKDKFSKQNSLEGVVSQPLLSDRRG